MEQLTNDTFMNKTKEGVVLVDFFATWCGPCKMLAPVLEQLQNEMPDVCFYKVDIDSEKELCERFKIMSVPTMVLFKDGKVVAQTSGYSPKEMIYGFIEKVM